MKKLTVLFLILLGIGGSAFAQVGQIQNPVTAPLYVQDAGTCSTANSFLVQQLPSNASTTTVNLSGTFSATITVRESNNGGATWTSAGATLSAAGTTTYSTNGFSHFCVDVTAYTSGTVQVSISTGILQVQSVVSGGGGGITPNSPLPAATSGPGPVFNVKNYGAKGNTRSSANCTGSSTNMNCTDVVFTAADIGDRVSCSFNFSNIVPSTTTFIAFVNATNMTMSAAGNGAGTCIFGAPDDAAVTAASTAAQAAMVMTNSAGNINASSGGAPTLYFPAGAYGLFNTGINLVNNGPSGTSGFTIMGDGLDQTKIYWYAGSTNAAGAAIACNSVANFKITGLTMDGAQQNHSFSNAALFPQCAGAIVRDVRVQRFGALGAAFPQSFSANNLQVQGNNNGGIQVTGGGEMYESLSTNNTVNLTIQNLFGMPTGAGFRWVNGLIDECGLSTGCVQVQNSTDVHFIGASVFTGMGVDGTSHVNLEGGSLGPFNTDANTSGVIIAAKGMVTASNVRFMSSGTGKCINNSGIFRDNGANSCESLWLVQSGTSTGTTAVLTVQGFTANANTLCSVGDALEVQGINTVGYNGYFPAGATSGITAMGTNTITYTTAGSNLGAIGVGGYAMCRNMQSYSGNLPVAMLNNPIPNTCYVTGTFGATTTAAPMCTFKVQATANITYIKASSTTVTACTVAPVVTITDGTGTQTLTITTAKSIWDSSVDASSGVNTTIFKPNGTITVSNTAGTCTTPPTNFAVSYNISPILSN